MRFSRRFSLLTMALGALLALPALGQEQASPAGAASAIQGAQQPTVVPHTSPAAQDKTLAAQQQTAEQDQGSRGHSADPNYRWHNGRWWYWQNGGWLLWSGSRWLNQQERSARAYRSAPGRSFSYTEDGQTFVPTDVGIPQSTASGLRRSTVAPGTVEYQRVVPSYGMRSAGSKVLGNY